MSNQEDTTKLYRKIVWRKYQFEAFEDGDKEILKNHTVDFISFSYYSSRLTSADPEELKKLEAGNAFASLKNPYLEASEWGWQIDPIGLE